MTDDFSKYIAMKDSGSSAEHVYVQATCDGLDAITKIRLIRAVFALSPGQAKEVALKADNIAQSLDEYQRKIADNLSPEG